MTRPSRSRHDASNVVPKHDERLLSPLRAAQPHGNADVSLLQSRGIVDAVSDHATTSPAIDRASPARASGRRDARKDLRLEHRVALLLADPRERRQRAPFDETRRARLDDAEISRSSAPYRISPYHNHADAGLFAGGNASFTSARAVAKTDKAEKAETVVGCAAPRGSPSRRARRASRPRPAPRHGEPQRAAVAERVAAAASTLQRAFIAMNRAPSRSCTSPSSWSRLEGELVSSYAKSSASRSSPASRPSRAAPAPSSPSALPRGRQVALLHNTPISIARRRLCRCRKSPSHR